LCLMRILGILSMYFDAVVVKYEKKLLLIIQILWQWICYLTCAQCSKCHEILDMGFFIKIYNQIVILIIDIDHF
jgi:hypothetical protein